MFHELNWLSLQYRRDFHKIVMVYKCQNSLAPQYLCDTFNANHDIHNHNTRNASLRVTKHATTAYYHALREESSQTNVILQYKLLASILSAVCSVIQQS